MDANLVRISGFAVSVGPLRRCRFAGRVLACERRKVSVRTRIGAQRSRKQAYEEAEEEEVWDFDDLDVDVEELERVEEWLTSFRDEVEEIATSFPFSRPVPEIVVKARNLNWLQMQAFYDAGIFDFRESSLLNVRDMSQHLPGDIQWRFENVRVESASKVLNRVHNLYAVEGVSELGVLDALEDAVQKNKRYRQQSKRCSVTVQASNALDEFPLLAADHIRRSCPSLRLNGVYFPSSSWLSGEEEDRELSIQLRSEIASRSKEVPAKQLEFGMPIERMDELQRAYWFLATGSSAISIAPDLAEDDDSEE